MSDASQGPGWWQASDGKWYPPEAATTATQTPPPQWTATPPPVEKRKGGLGKGCLLSLGIVAAVVILLIVIVSVAANKASNNLTKNANAGNLGGPAPAAKYAVGDTASTAGWRVTVYSFKDPYSPSNSAFNAPAGQHYVTVDVQVTNTDTTKAQAFSSIVAFHLLDSANHQYDETLVPELSPTAPDGQVPAGQSIRGFVAFQVPDGTTGLRFRAQGGFTAAGAVFTLS